jgi:hypothetical protein
VNFSIWRVLWAKIQLMTYAKLAALPLSIATDWDQVAAEPSCMTCCSFRRHLEAILAKKHFP